MSTEYVRKARELADRYDALLVFDEIQCGVGRVGRYFAYQLVRSRGAARYHGGGQTAGLRHSTGRHRRQRARGASRSAPGMHGSTFGGGPLACRVALEFMDILDDAAAAHRTDGQLLPDEARRSARSSFRSSRKSVGAA